MKCGGNGKMAHGSRYRVPLRRRREKKTDYQARKGFVVSGKPRLVARSSLKNTTAQIIEAKPHGDIVLASAHSNELVKKYGWKAATGNLPAAYLTGLLCGFKAKKKGVSEAILDLGLVSPTKGSKVFATLSGVVDAGVEIPHDPEKIVPERVEGQHIVEYAESLGTPEEFSPQFSTYLAKKMPPQKLGEHFANVKEEILASFGKAPKPETKPVKPVKAEEKPVAKKVEAKPAKAEAKAKPEAKAEAKTTKLSKAAAGKPKEKPAETKSTAKKAAAKPKEEKKPEKEKAEEAGAKSAKKSGGKKA
jgi:large subunit ribosomal protein L18